MKEVIEFMDPIRLSVCMLSLLSTPIYTLFLLDLKDDRREEQIKVAITVFTLAFVSCVSAIIFHKNVLVNEFAKVLLAYWLMDVILVEVQSLDLRMYQKFLLTGLAISTSWLVVQFLLI